MFSEVRSTLLTVDASSRRSEEKLQKALEMLFEIESKVNREYIKCSIGFRA
jgi:hypothetical protein